MLYLCKVIIFSDFGQLPGNFDARVGKKVNCSILCRFRIQEMTPEYKIVGAIKIPNWTDA